jgi:hypothetical protein
MRPKKEEANHDVESEEFFLHFLRDHWLLLESCNHLFPDFEYCKGIYSICRIIP